MAAAKHTLEKCGQGLVEIYFHAQGNGARGRRACSNFAEFVDLGLGKARRRWPANSPSTGARKRMLDSWITASTEKPPRRERIARDPRPNRSTPPANTNCHRTRCPCNWHWVRAGALKTTTASSGRTRPRPPICLASMNSPTMRFLQVIAAEIAGLQRHFGQYYARAPDRLKGDGQSRENPAANRCADRRTTRFKRIDPAPRDAANPLIDARAAGVSALACQHSAGDFCVAARTNCRAR